MALFEITTTTKAVMTLESSQVIAVIDESKVEGYKESMGKSHIFMFGGLSVRTEIPYERVKALLGSEVARIE